MQTFTVDLSRNPVTVFILIIGPLLAAAVFIGPLLYFPQSPDWLVILTIVIMMIIAVAGVKYVIKKWGSVPAEVTMNGEGITILLLQRSLFYPRKEYSSSWEGLENVSDNTGPNNDTSFYMISFRQPAVTVVLTPAGNADDQSEAAFGKVLLEYVLRFNAAKQVGKGSPILQQGFYESWWAKGLTLCVYLMIVTVIIMRITVPEKFSNWRLIQAGSVALLWLSVYHANRKSGKS